MRAPEHPELVCSQEQRGLVGILHVPPAPCFLGSCTRDKVPVCSPWREGTCHNQMVGSSDSPRGTPLRAGILQNAGVAECVDGRPAGGALGGGQLGAGPPGSLPPPAVAAPPGFWRQVWGSWWAGAQARGTAASTASPDPRTAPLGGRASASPVRAYCCPASKMINVTERSGEARTPVQNFLRSSRSPRMDAQTPVLPLPGVGRSGGVCRRCCRGSRRRG